MTREQLMKVNKDIEEWGLENIENYVLIKSGATNGDVIMTLFPNEYDFETDFDEEWWNAPYQKDGK